jgi:hypothetical protein
LRELRLLVGSQMYFHSPRISERIGSGKLVRA